MTIVNYIENEIEARIAYTENQIKFAEKELRKVEDQIKFFEGSLLAYNDLLQNIHKELKEMTNEQETT